MKKRFLSLMIAVVMILGIIPFGTVIASAEEEPVVVTTEEELISAFDAGAAYIKLGADIAVSATIFLDYSFTLDVAGYTLSTCEDFDPADMFSYSLPGEFIFTDSSQDRTGKITSAHNKDSIFWLSGEGATVIFQDITIESTGNLAYSSVVSFGTDLQFENCSIDTVTIEGDSDLTVTIGENVEVGNWSIGKGPSYSVDVSAFPGFDTDELKCVFDEESGWWTVVDKRDVIELQLYLKAIDSNGQEIEGMLDVELNDSRWVGTESCDYGSVSCFIGENVLTNW